MRDARDTEAMDTLFESDAGAGEPEGGRHPAEDDRPLAARMRPRFFMVQAKLISKRSPSRRAEKPAFRRIHSAGAWRQTPVYRRSNLPPAKQPGPALILDYGSTTLIPPGWSFSVDKFGSLTARAE